VGAFFHASGFVSHNDTFAAKFQVRKGVIATHGRGIWIIDDITPLRALTPLTLAQDVVFMRARPK
jgi:hypothetical protein